MVPGHPFVVFCENLSQKCQSLIEKLLCLGSNRRNRMLYISQTVDQSWLTCLAALTSCQ